MRLAATLPQVVLAWVLSLTSGCAGDPEALDADKDGAVDADDCDDADPAAYPGRAEDCDGIDNDCDGEIDEDLKIIVFADADADGYGAGGRLGKACELQEGESANADDCDDDDAAVNPAALEGCDEVDNDCDGRVDDEDDSITTSVQIEWYVDADGDGYGDPAGTTVFACLQPDGYGRVSDDCDDTDGYRNPGAGERCNGEDDNCDGVLEEVGLGALAVADFEVPGDEAYFTINGDAYWDDAYIYSGNLTLTDDLGDTGSAFLKETYEGARWQATFAFDISSELEWGDGMTFAWLDPESPASSLGETGPEMGFGGLNGFAVDFDGSDDGDDDESAFHVALVGGDGTVYATTGGNMYDVGSYSKNEVSVQFDQGYVEVVLNGNLVLTGTIPDYDFEMARFGLTGAARGSMWTVSTRR